MEEQAISISDIRTYRTFEESLLDQVGHIVKVYPELKEKRSVYVLTKIMLSHICGLDAKNENYNQEMFDNLMQEIIDILEQ